MDKDLISIIMPAYNAEPFIRESINSIANQTYHNWELIVIDDGSTDNTSRIVIQLQKSEPRIKYLYQQNGRQGKARNFGIKESRGNYIAFLDADDKWTEDKLSVQMDAFQKESNIALVFCQGYNLNGMKVTDCDVQVKKAWDINSLNDFLYHNQIPVLSVIVKKHALSDVGYFTEETNLQNAEDYHLWLKLLLNGHKFRSLSNRLFYYRIHTAQSTYQNVNTRAPIFYTYQDVYYLAKNAIQKKAIINKLKWYIFDEEFHTHCLKLFECHLKAKGLNMLSLAVKLLLGNPKLLYRKIVFRLISRFA